MNESADRVHKVWMIHSWISSWTHWLGTAAVENSQWANEISVCYSNNAIYDFRMLRIWFIIHIDYFNAAENFESRH